MPHAALRWFTGLLRRAPIAVLALACSTLGALGCEGGAEGPPARLPAPAEPKAEPPKIEAEKPAPLPVPTGATADRRGKLWIQTCEAPACPRKKQADAVQHCAQLKLGDGVDGWRLPSRTEAEGFAKLSGIAMREGYHWTTTAFDADARQFWIVDPSGKGRSTTIPGARKPMLARCVRAPKPASR